MGAMWLPKWTRSSRGISRDKRWVAAAVLIVAVSATRADLSDPEPYGACWIEVSILRLGGGSFDAPLFYPASESGQGASYDGSGAPYPAISFGRGRITAVTRYQSTLEPLASWGHFVIASKSYGRLPPDHGAFADDLRWCLTRLEGQHAKPSPWPFEQVNTAEFGFSGHSMGGGASILAAERDGRIRVVANMAAAVLSSVLISGGEVSARPLPEGVGATAFGRLAYGE